MIKILKRIFHNSTKETIEIFENKTKIDYDPTIFSSLKVISITKSKLEYLNPLSVFVNLQILNLSHNKIKDISCLKDLKKLKIIDLRFNKIETIPKWLFEVGKPIYWERESEEEEGIFLEGNPINKKIIFQIKREHKQNLLKAPIVPKENILVKPLLIQKKEKKTIDPISIEIAQLVPLERQLLTIFIPQDFSSNFINIFIKKRNSSFKLNTSIIEYSDSYKIIGGNNIQEIKYIVLILKESECCLNPPILELISKLYQKSKIFLIIEKTNIENMEKKINFFKTYNKSINIVNVYHSSDKKSNELIRENIYTYLEKTPEANTLWKTNWIELRDEIENMRENNIEYKEFQSIADKYNLSLEVREEIFKYLKKVGSIMESPQLMYH